MADSDKEAEWIRWLYEHSEPAEDPRTYAIIPDSFYPAYTARPYAVSVFMPGRVPPHWRTRDHYVADEDHPLGGYDGGGFISPRRINLEKFQDRWGDPVRAFYRFNRPEDEAA